jgi:ATP-dependent DNA ligase
MKARVVDEIPREPGWHYEPKWDGFRALGFWDGREVYLSSRGEQPFSRYFPELVEALAEYKDHRFVVDGEIVIFKPDGRSLDFNALGQRIHPAASRVQRLRRETPASFFVFDLLALDGEDLRPAPLATRRAALERVFGHARPPLFLTPASQDFQVAQGWLDGFIVEGFDGVVGKRLDSIYRPDEREMVKIKRQRTIDCVVFGFRWAKDQRGVAVGSLLLGLYDGEHLVPVGFSSGFTQKVRRELVPLLEEHRSGPTQQAPPGHNGASRWGPDRDASFEPLKPELVCEVGFDQVTGHRIRHGARFLRWRPDKPPGECRVEGVLASSGVSVGELLGAPLTPVDQSP